MTTRKGMFSNSLGSARRAFPPARCTVVAENSLAKFSTMSTGWGSSSRHRVIERARRWSGRRSCRRERPRPRRRAPSEASRRSPGRGRGRFPTSAPARCLALDAAECRHRGVVDDSYVAAALFAELVLQGEPAPLRVETQDPSRCRHRRGARGSRDARRGRRGTPRESRPLPGGTRCFTMRSSRNSTSRAGEQG